MFAWTRDANPTQLARIVAPPLRDVQPVRRSNRRHRLALSVSSTKSVTLSAPLHYSYRTEQAYVDWIRRFILFRGKQHPQNLGARDVGSVEPPHSCHS